MGCFPLQINYLYLYLYCIGVWITLKGENPSLHSVNTKNPETILRLFSSDTPGQTGTQFTAKCTETLIFTSPSRRSRTQVWCTSVTHQETLFPSCYIEYQKKAAPMITGPEVAVRMVSPRQSPVQLLTLAHVA